MFIRFKSDWIPAENLIPAMATEVDHSEPPIPYIDWAYAVPLLKHIRVSPKPLPRRCSFVICFAPLPVVDFVVVICCTPDRVDAHVECSRVCLSRSSVATLGRFAISSRPLHVQHTLAFVLMYLLSALIMASATWSTQHATATLEASPEVFIRICYCIINATSE